MLPISLTYQQRRLLRKRGAGSRFVWRQWPADGDPPRSCTGCMRMDCMGAVAARSLNSVSEGVVHSSQNPSQGALCDNLLAANWSPSDLPQLAILGNSFDTYRERWSGPPGLRPSTTRPDKLLQLVEAGEAGCVGSRV